MILRYTECMCKRLMFVDFRCWCQTLAKSNIQSMKYIDRRRYSATVMRSSSTSCCLNALIEVVVFYQCAHTSQCVVLTRWCSTVFYQCTYASSTCRPQTKYEVIQVSMFLCPDSRLPYRWKPTFMTCWRRRIMRRRDRFMIKQRGSTMNCVPMTSAWSKLFFCFF